MTVLRTSIATQSGLRKPGTGLFVPGSWQSYGPLGLCLSDTKGALRHPFNAETISADF